MICPVVALLVLLAWAELVWLLQKDFNHLAFPNSYIVAIQKRVVLLKWSFVFFVHRTTGYNKI
jgi:hypothetical protein